MPIDLHIVEVPVGHGWAFESLADLSSEISIETYGEDRTIGLATLRHVHADERNGLRVFLMALKGGNDPAGPRGRFGLSLPPSHPAEVVATVEFHLPTRDNTHLADDVWLQVRNTQRRQGIGRALWREVARIARAHERSTLLMWSDHLIESRDPSLPWVAPSTGVGEIPLGPAAGFALAMGHSLEQVERQSRLVLPVEPRRLAQLRTAAEPAFRRYRVESWAGAADAGRATALATLNRALSTDAPRGGILWEAEDWDAERVRGLEERMLLTGQLFTSIASEATTGDAVAMTQLYCEYDHPHRVEQWNTVVSAAHRGARLGLAVKVANLQLLASVWTQAREITTWNAGENAAMLAINTELGYRPYALSAAWQRRIDDPAAG